MTTSGVRRWTGGHVGSRGSLLSIRDSGAEDFSDSPEDQVWERMVLEASMDHSDAIGCFGNDSWVSAALEPIQRIFELYLGREAGRFNEKFFRPADH